MIKQESVQEVMQRIDIVEVIGNFLSLKKRGANYLALCPFHNEKTPSFNVNPARGVFKCFGCGQGGDAISFIREYEKFSFVEAIRWLAQYYQIELEEQEYTEEQQENRAIEESLRAINEFANQYFQNNLWESEEGKVVAGQYFQNRGFTTETIKKFDLGYALDEWELFYKKALEAGFKEELLEQAGLIRKRETKIYDTYRGRIIFPIKSSTGSVLGFGARILNENAKAPKYINSPESKLYVKNRVLYGMYEGRRAIGQQDNCYLVEGYTDVISMHQAGIENVVASSGTSLTLGQIRLIKQITQNLTLLYDGDEAGITASARALDIALEEGLRVQIVPLGKGQDPDSFISSQGADAFKAYLDKNQQDFLTYSINSASEKGKNDPILKSNLVNEIAQSLAKIKKVEDFTLQSYYIKKAADAFDVEEEGMVSLVNQFIRQEVTQVYRQEQREQQETERKARLEQAGLDDVPVVDENGELVFPTAIPDQPKLPKVNQAEQQMAWQLIKVLLSYGEKDFEDATVAHKFYELITVDDIGDPLAREIALEYYDLWLAHGDLPPIQHFTSHKNEEIKSQVAQVLTETHVPSENWSEKYKIDVHHGDEIYEEEVQSTFAYFQLKTLRKLIEENFKLIKKHADSEDLSMYMQTHLDLKAKEKSLMSLVILK